MKRSEQFIFSPDLTRLFAAAVVSPDFCQTLLQDAASALASGYQGETFILPPAEEALILSIEANSLTDFASQVVDGKRVPNESTNSRQPTSSPARGYEQGLAFGAFPGI